MVLMYLDPLQLPVLGKQDLSRVDVRGVWLENGDLPRRFMRRAPTFVDDPQDQAGAFAAMVDCEIFYPPVFAAAIPDVTIAGYRTVVTADGYFFNDDPVQGDALAQYLARIGQADPFSNELTGLKSEGDTFTFDPGSRETVHVPGQTIVLCSHEPSNYGSWLFRTLPKLATLRRLDLADNTRMLVWLPNGPFAESLDLLGIGPERRIEHDPEKLFRLDAAVVPGLRNNQAYLDPESHAFLAGICDAFGGRLPRKGKRLYVARYKLGQTPNNGRVLLNEAELIARLERLGFETVYPGALNFREQVTTFAAADLVVGASGSAMFNVVFCHPGTKVIDIESEPHWIHAHMCLFSSCGLEYGVFLGKPDPTDPATVHRRWTVDIDMLVKRIERFAPRSIWVRVFG